MKFWNSGRSTQPSASTVSRSVTGFSQLMSAMPQARTTASGYVCPVERSMTCTL